MKKQLYHAFTTRLDLVCGKDELRPEFMAIHFKNGFAYATDAIMAVKIPLERYYFSDEDKSNLEGKKLTVPQFSMIFNREIIIQPGVITIPEMGVSITLSPIYRPDYIVTLERYFSNKEIVPVGKIGINQRLIPLIAKCLDANVLIFRFNTDHKVIIITSIDEDKMGMGLIMPVMI